MERHIVTSSLGAVGKHASLHLDLIRSFSSSSFTLIWFSHFRPLSSPWFLHQDLIRSFSSSFTLISSPWFLHLDIFTLIWFGHFRPLSSSWFLHLDLIRSFSSSFFTMIWFSHFRPLSPWFLNLDFFTFLIRSFSSSFFTLISSPWSDSVIFVLFLHLDFFTLIWFGHFHPLSSPWSVWFGQFHYIILKQYSPSFSSFTLVCKLSFSTF